MNPSLAREEIQAIILQAVHQTNLARDATSQLSEAPDALLYAAGSPLDSLGLVALLMDIEDALRDRGAELSLADEHAMSQKRSPFRDVATLVEYIHQRLSATAS